MTDFFIENVKETLEAINKLLEKKIREVNVKKIRICNNIKSSGIIKHDNFLGNFNI